MSETAYESVDSESGPPCLSIILEPMASHIRASDGRDIPFTRAMLSVRNVCQVNAIDLLPHAMLSQEGGTVQDVTQAISIADGGLKPGESVSWDVYDLLLPKHTGTASKIHMFGYRAALNWTFDLSVWAEYHLSGSSKPLRTHVARWGLRWHVADPTTGAVALEINVPGD